MYPLHAFAPVLRPGLFLCDQCRPCEHQHVDSRYAFVVKYGRYSFSGQPQTQCRPGQPQLAGVLICAAPRNRHRRKRLPCVTHHVITRLRPGLHGRGFSVALGTPLAGIVLLHLPGMQRSLAEALGQIRSWPGVFIETDYCLR